jgi:predicted  nucleic acid-binding Zn-ribbon protein
VASADLSGQIQNFKDLSRRRELVIKNETHRIGKSVDQKVGHAVLQLERKAGLMGKDIESLKALDAEIDKVITELGRRKDETAALSAKVNSISQTLTGKSEKDDLKLRKQMEVLQSDVKNRLETAEARILKENVRSFSEARHSIRKDVHALRVENATLKAEIRNLRSIGGAVNDLQQAFVAVQKKVDDSVNNVEKIASGVSSDIEKQALKVSKDLAGVSAGLKADLKDVIAREKERFAGQSAELDAKYAGLTKNVTGLSGQAAETRQTATANARGLAALDRRVGALMKEIVGLKKEYKVEMGKLLKELEG